MVMPLRTEVKEDVLPLQRALRSLEDAKLSLKQFSQTGSVGKDQALAESVSELRRKLKKSRKLAKDIAERWFHSSTY
jgi:hypothetical protein